MRIAISGATGFIGSALSRKLTATGHDVHHLVRRDPRNSAEIEWHPKSGHLDPTALTGMDAVVHLAGAGIGDRPWTAAYRRELNDSRELGTRTVATALAAMDQPPRVLVSASAVGYYGDTGDHSVDETALRGKGFLAELVEAWEAAAEPAKEAGIRVVHPRSGLVMAPTGGIAGKLRPLFRLGLGARLGNGLQWMSWISLHDEVAALIKVIEDDTLSGPVNLVAPQPVRNADFTRIFARALNRPAPLMVPAPVLRLALRDLADEALLAGQRVRPAKLRAAGFPYRHDTLAAALKG
ncbi:MAG: TIGR01777 family protein [Streptosporangiales bacterium]|nr:TIGR01777 family protein [Streptosporangiales bacterium]